MAEHNSTERLPQLNLRRSTLKTGMRQKTTQATEPNGNNEELASRIFDQAVIRSGLTNKEISDRLGGLSESLIGRWRNPNAREFPNTLQLQKLGPVFLREFSRASNQYNGLGRQALCELLNVVGDLAVAVGE